jgi:hypothetical protein
MKRSIQATLVAVAITGLFLAAVTSNAGLVLHWKFNEGTGTTANDSTGGGHDGTLTNMDAADWVNTGLPDVPSGSSYALDFDGANDFVIASGDAYKGVVGTAERTIAAWIKGTKLNACVANWGVNTAGQKWTFRVQDGNGTAGALRVEVNGGYQVGNTVINDDAWHHVAAVLPSQGSPDVSHIRLYVDGILEDISASQVRAINTVGTQTFRVANDFSTRRFQGRIDEVRLYDHALTSTEIRALAGVTDAYPDAVLADSPIAYWRLAAQVADDGIGINEGSLGPVNGIFRQFGAGYFGQTGLVSANSDRCALFDATAKTNYVEIPNHGQINTSGPFSSKTFELWFNMDAAVTGNVVLYEQGGGGNGMNVYIQEDTGNHYLRYGAWQGTGSNVHFPTRVPITAGTVYHVASVYNDAGNTFMLFLNGAPVSAKVSGNIAAIPNHTGLIAIGGMLNDTELHSGDQSGDGLHFTGYIDDVALYNSVLTLESIQTHYATGSGDRLGIMEYATLGATLNYDAANDSDGDTSFEDSIGTRQNNATANAFDWNLSGMTAPSRKSVGGGVLSKIRYAYRFDGSDTAWCQEFDSVAGNPTTSGASLEIVFKPTDFSGQEALLETGGNGSGTAIWLDGNTLRFDVKNGSIDARATYNLTGLPAAEQASFIHVVGVADIAGDQALLYVNGLLRNAPAASGNLADWAGTDDSGLGSIRGTQAFGTPGGFNGDIALARLYPHILDSGRVTNNYEALLSRGGVFLIK